MSNDHGSDIARLFFWFVWLSGFFLAIFLLFRSFYFSVLLGQIQLAIPFFMAFLWQSIVQTTALKRYQSAEQLRDPFLVQLVGSLVLVLLVTVALALRG